MICLAYGNSVWNTIRKNFFGRAHKNKIQLDQTFYNHFRLFTFESALD